MLVLVVVVVVVVVVVFATVLVSRPRVEIMARRNPKSNVEERRIRLPPLPLRRPLLLSVGATTMAMVPFALHCAGLTVFVMKVSHFEFGRRFGGFILFHFWLITC